MASAATTTFSHFFTLPRWHSNCKSLQRIKYLQIADCKLQKTYILTATSKREIDASLADDASEGEDFDVEKTTTRGTSKRAPTRRKKKAVLETAESSLSAASGDDVDKTTMVSSESSETPKKSPRRTRKKVISNDNLDGVETEKKLTRRTKKKVEDTEGSSETNLNEHEEDDFVVNVDDDDEEEDLDIKIGEDISHTYGWPPLVCCFGSAQHEFLPSGRPANRLVDYEMHDRRKGAWWAPVKFFRAPGGCASSVAIALSSLGGKVAFMGKLGDDDWGQSLLYNLDLNEVQTQSVRFDSKRATSVSQMKMSKRGGLRMTCVKPCAEDSLSKSEIDIDVLKEARMFYFDTFSLLDPKMRSSALRAIKISKKLGSVILYDVNLPLTLWHSGKEAKMFIQCALDLADIIEVTKQELEFLCGIKTSEKFDTRDYDSSKFVHYEPEVVAPLWHENLKILFVTNGTSMISYYTKEHDGSLLGMEDPPVTAFTCDMSAAGDAIIAALMHKLTVQPHLLTDIGYLELSIRYAINRGVTAQWRLARTRGHPPKEGMEDDISPNPWGIKMITDREYRTVSPVS